MDRLQQICAEIIRLYRQQLNVWVLGKIAKLKTAVPSPLRPQTKSRARGVAFF